MIRQRRYQGKRKKISQRELERQRMVRDMVEKRWVEAVITERPEPPKGPHWAWALVAVIFIVAGVLYANTR